MPEEERLKLVSSVEDDFTVELENLEDRLEGVDEQIRQTGGGEDRIKIDVDVTGVEKAITELEALNREIEKVDNELTIRTDRDGAVSPTVPDGDGGRSGANAGAMATSGGFDEDMFTIENIDDWEDAVEPFLDREKLARKGGETDRLSGVLDRELSELVDMDEAARLARRSDTDIDIDTLRDLDTPGVQSTLDAISDLDAEGLTMLGGRKGRGKDMKHAMSNLRKLRFTMGTFHQVLASVIPLMGIFVGALPATIVGLGALASAALGAAAVLGGIGVLGAAGLSLEKTGDISMEPIKKRLKEVGENFEDAFAPLAETLAPVVRTALSDIEAMAGPLATASAGLLVFRDEFEAFIGVVTGGLPKVMNSWLSFTDAAMPMVLTLTDFLTNMDLLGSFAEHLSRAWVELVLIGNAILDLIPVMMDMSHVFLSVTAGLFAFAGVIASVIDMIPYGAQVIGVLAAGFLLLLTYVTLASVATSGLIASTAALAGTIVTSALPGLASYITSVYVSMVATYGFAGAVATLIGIVTLGIGTIAIFSAGFSELADNIGGSRSELEKFANTASGLRGIGGMSVGSPTGGGSSNAYGGGMTTVIKSTSRDDAARQQYSSEYEQKQHVDSVFGG